MKSTVNTNTALLGAAILLVSVMPLAQAAKIDSLALMESIPFSFVVQGKALAAGDYTIDQDSASFTSIVRSTDAKSAAIALVAYQEPAGPRESARLVFHRYGDQYFLSEVWIPNRYHSTVSPTPIERELAAKQNKPGESRLVALR